MGILVAYDKSDAAGKVLMLAQIQAERFSGKMVSILTAYDKSPKNVMGVYTDA